MDNRDFFKVLDLFQNKFWLIYPFNTFWLIWEVRAEKRPYEWLGRVLGVWGLAPLTRNSQINQKVLTRVSTEKKVPPRHYI